MENNKFTVIMCTYFKDDPYLLRKAVESVFENSIKPDYFILTIDGPLPKFNEDVIKRLSITYPIKLNYIEKNVGLALALNKTLEIVETEWVARADSDDMNLKNRFARQLEYIDKNFDVIGSNILEIDIQNKLPNLQKKMPTTHIKIKNYSRHRNPINHMTAFYRLNAVKSVGGYPNIYLREDYALWAKLLNKNFHFHNINEILVHANAGKSLYKRRGGFKNSLAEIKLQFLLYRCNLKPFYLLIIDLILRTTVLSLPSSILEKIYVLGLRSKNLIS